MLSPIRRLYRGRVKQLVDETRLKSILSYIYEGVVLLQTGGKLTKEVDGYTATFAFESSNEFLSLDSFRGEHDVLVGFLEDVDSSDIVYDIGANVGFYSVFTANNYPDATVIAVEPHSDNVDKLHRSADLNDGTIQTYETLLSDRTGFSPLPMSTGVPGISDLSIGGTEQHFVPSYRANEMLNIADLPTPTVLKVDVEGAELDVLTGFNDALNDVRLIYCEVHKKEIGRFGWDPEDVASYLQDRRFRTERIQESEEAFHLRAVKRN